ncbi:MAG: hypothetical protein CMJ85_00420 [Planctomycetes bacterium]|jgi:hypothetical protein|nr:hypothetical protein [Planctomycetota bacterium]
MAEEGKSNRREDGESSGINSAEYKHRLLNKLNCLIAVLEIAIGKIERSMQSDDADQDRLTRIKSNLENTLAICRRAKGTLESKIVEASADDPTTSPPSENALTPTRENLSFRCYVELSSIDEFRKFRDLPAITSDDIADTDLDDLTRLLSEDE